MKRRYPEVYWGNVMVRYWTPDDALFMGGKKPRLLDPTTHSIEIPNIGTVYLN